MPDGEGQHHTPAADARHARLMELFDAATELPAADRTAFLNRMCCHDSDLRADVASLLTHDHAPPGALDSPLLGTGFNVAQFVTPDATLEADRPAQIGPYRILGLLGAGSMGVVYRAHQDVPPRTVALKIMHPGRVSRTAQRRFVDEVESLGRLRHPGIAQIYAAATEHTTHGPRPYMAMELVEGQPLLRYAEEQHLDSTARLKLLARICDAVQHAHQHGVIHRDLKPANILVEEADDGPCPRILDFGVARLIDRDSEAATALTQQGQLVGTLAYMSPEQVGGDPHEIDTRSDVYALGVIGYELLCGRLPIEVQGRSVLTALHAIQEQVPPPLAAHDRQFRGDLSTILQKTLAKDKHQRYESASALAADIRRYLNHLPILAHPPSPLYALRKFVRRHRVLAAVVLLGALGSAYGLLRARWAQMELRAQYEATRDIASFLVGDFAGNLDRINGTTALRRDMLQRLRTQIESLLIRNPLDQTLLRAQADVMERTSDLEVDEGNFTAAGELRDAVLLMRRRLADAAPHDPERQADLSVAIVKVGDVIRARGELEATEPWYRQALELDERLVREYPDRRRLLDNLGHSYARMGWLIWRIGSPVETERLYQQGLDTYARLLELYPDALITVYGCWEIERLLGEMLLEQGRFAAADQHVQNSLWHATQLITSEPGNRLYLTAYAQASKTAAGSAARQGAMPDAVQLIRESRRVAEQNCATDPTNRAMRDELCQILMAQADVLARAGQDAEAYRFALQALNLARQLPDIDPTAGIGIRRLAGALCTAARAAMRLGLTEEAEQYAREELEHRRQLADRQPPNPARLAEYAEHLLEAPVSDRPGPQYACEVAARAVALPEGNTPKLWYILGRCCVAIHDDARAKACFEHALALTPTDADALRPAICRQLDRLAGQESAE